jgi:hypothetical protein
MAQKETAEQKLLKIIEATKKSQAAASGAGGTVAIAKKPAARIPFTSRQLNMVLIFATIMGLFYFLLELRNGLGLVKQDVVFSVEDVLPQESLKLFVPQIKSIAYYLDKMSSRDLFKPDEKKEDGSSAMPTEKAALEKKMFKYKVVGVAWLDVPESATVMIEDKSNSTTRFLKEGDKIDDVTVKTIFTNKVVFSYANEEIVIKL